MKTYVRIAVLLYLLTLTSAQNASAKTIVVKFIGALQKAMNEANAGDTVLVTNGMYTMGTEYPH
jgi:poly(beta-D-mannuronate) lyase